MKLFLNATSPYARLVLVTAFETGLRQLELDWSDPWASPQALTAVNPFATVPVLVTDSGRSLVESTFICKHLLALQSPAHRPGVRQVADDDEAALARLGLGKNLMDSAFRLVLIDRFFADATRHTLAERAEAAICRALGGLESPPPAAAAQPDIADLCLAVALAYVHFRRPALFDAATRPATRAWLASFTARPSFERSTPERLGAGPATVGQL